MADYSEPGSVRCNLSPECQDVLREVFAELVCSSPARGCGVALCYFYTELLVLLPKTPMQVCYEFLIWGGRGGGGYSPP